MLQELDISYNCIAGSGAAALAGLIVRGSPLQVCFCSHVALGSVSRSSMHHRPRLSLIIGVAQVLLLAGNAVGDEGAHALEVALRRTKTLLRLDLTSNGIGDDGLVAIARGLDENRSVQEIRLWVRPAIRAA